MHALLAFQSIKVKIKKEILLLLYEAAILDFEVRVSKKIKINNNFKKTYYVTIWNPDR